MSLSGKKILLGVSGGIAAYKAAGLLRDFQKAGATVRVVMTPSATRFVGVETFATLSRHEVAVDFFDDSDPGQAWTRHIQWAEWSDLFLVAPCTANTLAKLVHGLADNMLTSIALAARCPLMICPTMDAGMIDHPAVRANLDLAAKQGIDILEPEEGYLASGLEGTGRLPEPSVILEAAGKLLLRRPAGPLTGKRVLVTAGPTREPIDAVRFISNPSSGRMGLAMALAAQRMGGDVLLLHGPVEPEIPSSIPHRRIDTARELFEEVRAEADADVVIMAAAVADYTPSSPSGGKLAKSDREMELSLQPTTDILQWLGERKKKGQTLIGFAMESGGAEERALEKLRKKNLDWICANDISEPGAGFGLETNRILLLDGRRSHTYSGSKETIAGQILRTIFDSAGNS